MDQEVALSVFQAVPRAFGLYAANEGAWPLILVVGGVSYLTPQRNTGVAQLTETR
jgi:hypothetical protein